MVASKRALKLKKFCVLGLVQLEEALRLSPVSFLVYECSWTHLAERFHPENAAGFFMPISTELGKEVHHVGLLGELLRLCMCLIQKSMSDPRTVRNEYE